MSDDFVVETTNNGVAVPNVPDPVEPVQDSGAEAVVEQPELPELVEAKPDEASVAGKQLAAKKGSLQARIDAITKEKYDTQRERDEARQKADALDRELQALKSPKAPDTKQPDTSRYTRPKPTEDEIGAKYQTYGEYVEDLTDWKVEQRESQRTQQDYISRARQTFHQSAEQFTKEFAAIVAAKPNFWDGISDNVKNLAPERAPGTFGPTDPGQRADASTAIAAVIMSSSVKAEMLEHLSAHDDLLQRLLTLPPAHLFREMGRLEATFTRPEAAASTGPAAATRPVISQAPPPIKPVGTMARAGDPADDATEDMDLDQFIKVGNAAEVRRNKSGLR